MHTACGRRLSGVRYLSGRSPFMVRGDAHTAVEVVFQAFGSVGCAVRTKTS